MSPRARRRRFPSVRWGLVYLPIFSTRRSRHSRLVQSLERVTSKMAEPDAAYHYPPDVFEAVVEAVPLITRSKQDVLTFFRGCGVSQALVSELAPWALSGSDKS